MVFSYKQVRNGWKAKLEDTTIIHTENPPSMTLFGSVKPKIVYIDTQDKFVVQQRPSG